jgi:hypothetical protein
LLDKGKIIDFGETDKIISKYLNTRQEGTGDLTLPAKDTEVILKSFSVTQNGKQTPDIAGEYPFKINFDFSVTEKLRFFRTGFFLKNSLGAVITRSFIQDFRPDLEEITPGDYHCELNVPERLLMAGQYEIELKLFCFGVKDYFSHRKIEKQISVFSPKGYNELRSKNTDTRGYFHISNTWDVNNQTKNQ